MGTFARETKFLATPEKGEVSALWSGPRARVASSSSVMGARLGQRRTRDVGVVTPAHFSRLAPRLPAVGQQLLDPTRRACADPVEHVAEVPGLPTAALQSCEAGPSRADRPARSWPSMSGPGWPSRNKRKKIDAKRDWPWNGRSCDIRLASIDAVDRVVRRSPS